MFNKEQQARVLEIHEARLDRKISIDEYLKLMKGLDDEGN